MALIWNDFVWTMKQWNRPRSSTPASGSYTITSSDRALTASLTTASTWTLPAPSGGGQVLKIKNKGIPELTLSGTIFLDTLVTTLILSQGDMVSLTDDGSAWSVGD